MSQSQHEQACPKRVNRSLVAILIVAALLSVALPLLNVTIVYPAFTQIIASAIEDDAQRLANYVLPGSLKNTPLDYESFNDRFFADIYKLEHDFEVMKIKVFSAKGEVLYSSEPTDVGHLNSKPYFLTTVAKGKPYTQLVSKQTTPADGISIPIDVVETYVPFMNEGRFLGAFELYYDITKRKEKLEALATYSTIGMVLLSAGLMTALAIMLRNENARQEALWRAEELKEHVQHITRHDLKSPIAGMLAGTRYLLDFTTLDPEQKSILGDMRTTGNRAMDLINRSMDIYKMETDTYAYTPVVTDILGITRQVMMDLSDLARAKGCKVNITISGEPPVQEATVLAPVDDTLYYSIVANLLKNGLEASKVGDTVSVNLSTGLAVSVSINNPTPVPEEIREHFFEKYATSGKQTGTGLGTYSARLMAETMGGNIAMETNTVNGTTVTVNLPLPEKSTT